jgi:hypothetical protein
MQTPGFIALRAGVGCEASFIMEGEDLDPRSGGIEDAFVFIGAGKFTL